MRERRGRGALDENERSLARTTRSTRVACFVVAVQAIGAVFAGVAQDTQVSAHNILRVHLSKRVLCRARDPGAGVGEALALPA